jgi:hypothetical protein
MAQQQALHKAHIHNASAILLQKSRQDRSDLRA